MRRREFLAASVAAAVPAASASGLTSRICLFTDHLGGFSIPEVARMLKELGVTGPDLTVRKGGLVAPDQAATELPKASAIFRDHGLSIPMITTGVVSADAQSESFLRVVAKAGIPYYKLGYTPYGDISRWQQRIVETRGKLQELARLNQKLGLKGALHNHSGETVGCCVWDTLEALDGVDPSAMGLMFDPAHATIEGGKMGWNLSFRRAEPRAFIISVKDFVWEKSEKGWRTRWVPLGEGMMNFRDLMPLIRSSHFPGPLTLHIEYDPGGKTKTERYDKALDAAAKDLSFLRRHLSA